MDNAHTKRVFWVMFLAAFTAMLGVGIIAPTMPQYAQKMGAMGVSLGLIYSAFSAARTIFMPLAGKLSDKRGRKIFIVMGLSIYAMASLGYVWSNSVAEMIWIRLIHGMGSAMVVPIAMAVIGDIAPKGKEGTRMGTFSMSLFLGYGAGPLLGGVIQDHLGMESVFYFMGALTFLALLLLIFFLPEKKYDKAKEKKEVSSIKVLWPIDQFKGLMLFRFFYAIGRGAIIAFLPILAVSLDLTPSQIGFIISINILITAVFQHFFGKMADRFSRPLLIVAGSLISAVLMLFIPFVQTYTHFIVLGFLMGIGSGIAFPAAAALATDMGRSHGMGNMMGFFNMGMSLGMIVGPITAGVVMDLFGLPAVFLGAGIVWILGSGLCYYLMVHKQGALNRADV